MEKEKKKERSQGRNFSSCPFPGSVYNGALLILHAVQHPACGKETGEGASQGVSPTLWGGGGDGGYMNVKWFSKTQP